MIEWLVVAVGTVWWLGGIVLMLALALDGDRE